MEGLQFQKKLSLEALTNLITSSKSYYETAYAIWLLYGRPKSTLKFIESLTRILFKKPLANEITSKPPFIREGDNTTSDEFRSRCFWITVGIELALKYSIFNSLKENQAAYYNKNAAFKIFFEELPVAKDALPNWFSGDQEDLFNALNAVYDQIRTIKPNQSLEIKYNLITVSAQYQFKNWKQVVNTITKSLINRKKNEENIVELKTNDPRKTIKQSENISQLVPFQEEEEEKREVRNKKEKRRFKKLEPGDVDYWELSTEKLKGNTEMSKILKKYKRQKEIIEKGLIAKEKRKKEFFKRRRELPIVPIIPQPLPLIPVPVNVPNQQNAIVPAAPLVPLAIQPFNQIDSRQFIVDEDVERYLMRPDIANEINARPTENERRALYEHLRNQFFQAVRDNANRNAAIIRPPIQSNQELVLFESMEEDEPVPNQNIIIAQPPIVDVRLHPQDDNQQQRENREERLIPTSIGQNISDIISSALRDIMPRNEPPPNLAILPDLSFSDATESQSSFSNATASGSMVIDDEPDISLDEDFFNQPLQIHGSQSLARINNEIIQNEIERRRELRREPSNIPMTRSEASDFENRMFADLEQQFANERRLHRFQDLYDEEPWLTTAQLENFRRLEIELNRDFENARAELNRQYEQRSPFEVNFDVPAEVIRTPPLSPRNPPEEDELRRRINALRLPVDRQDQNLGRRIVETVPYNSDEEEQEESIDTTQGYQSAEDENAALQRTQDYISISDSIAGTGTQAYNDDTTQTMTQIFNDETTETLDYIPPVVPPDLQQDIEAEQIPYGGGGPPDDDDDDDDGEPPDNGPPDNAPPDDEDEDEVSQEFRYQSFRKVGEGHPSRERRRRKIRTIQKKAKSPYYLMGMKGARALDKRPRGPSDILAGWMGLTTGINPKWSNTRAITEILGKYSKSVPRKWGKKGLKIYRSPTYLWNYMVKDRFWDELIRLYCIAPIPLKDRIASWIPPKLRSKFQMAIRKMCGEFTRVYFGANSPYNIPTQVVNNWIDIKREQRKFFNKHKYAKEGRSRKPKK